MVGIAVTALSACAVTALRNNALGASTRAKQALLKAGQWWESDLMPIIFLFSAIVSGVALLMLLYVVTSKLRRALLVLMNVLMMRWNVVICGQEIAKTGKGLLTYHMPVWGREGLASAIVLTLAPFGLLGVLIRLFPPWANPPGSE